MLILSALFCLQTLKGSPEQLGSPEQWLSPESCSTSAGIELEYKENEVILRDSTHGIMKHKIFPRSMGCDEFKRSIYATLKTWDASLEPPPFEKSQTSTTILQFEVHPADTRIQILDAANAPAAPELRVRQKRDTAELWYKPLDKIEIPGISNQKIKYRLERSTYHSKWGVVDVQENTQEVITIKDELEPDHWAIGITTLIDLPAELSVSHRVSHSMWFSARVRLFFRPYDSELVSNPTIVPGLQLRNLWMRPSGWAGLELGYGLTLTVPFWMSVSARFMLTEYIVLGGVEIGPSLDTKGWHLGWMVETLGFRIPW